MDVRAAVALAGIVLIAGVMTDAFQTMVLPRRATLRVRLSALFYRWAWQFWGAISRVIREPRARERFLGNFGPLSVILLLALWVLLLITGFAMLQWGIGSHLVTPDGRSGFAYDLYMSGTTFVTLGLGDVIPTSDSARLVTVLEAATGFSFLAVLVGYLPVLYQTFAQREVDVWLQAVHAGTPPSVAGVLTRYTRRRETTAMVNRMTDWERWVAQLLDTHLSHTPLAYFRSQHFGQSWVGALTVVLDLCAMLIVGIEGYPTEQAEATFAAAQQAAKELSEPYAPRYLKNGNEAFPDRLPAEELIRLRALLVAAGLKPTVGPQADAKLAELRAGYEPAVQALAAYLRMPLPAWYNET